MSRVLLALLLLLLRPAVATAQEAGLELIAEDGGVTRLSAGELAALPRVTVASTDRDGNPIALSGPSLRSLVDLVGAPAGHDLRGPRLMLAVIAEAADGYRVLFSLAELDPAFGGNAVIVALTQNGGPLPTAEGPLRVAVAGEKHVSRWVRQVVRLRVLKVTP